MALTRGHALVTVVARTNSLAKAAEKLRAELEAYPDARITSLTQTSNNSALNVNRQTTIVAAIDYTPSTDS